MEFRLAWIGQVLLAFHAWPSLGFHHVLPRDINQKPTQVIGGVTVIDTPLDTFLYNHIMRTWLFGALVVNHNNTLKETVDLEVHAIGSMLHDLGLVLNGSWITQDRRFEVDSAVATTDFVERQVSNYGEGAAWDPNRLQLLFDSVLLSSEYRFSLYKQPTVAVLVTGVLIDLKGLPSLAAYGITPAEYYNVEAAFPRLNFITGTNATLVQLCTAKPNSTYDSWQQAFGDAFVPGYSAVGQRILDFFVQMYLAEAA
ncbi:hypothetical protein F5883DRAFT_588831 [Diaporthe sp. PMI_573]|nr:hypothetical protein F5883DRAFT_588831 [Diaporthaceae sp. PMI_573]